MTRAAFCFLAAVVQTYAQRSIVPDYTQSSIVHSATNTPGLLAPNTIATVYGVNLATGTHSLQISDLAGGRIPVSSPSTGAHILINGIRAPLYYVSPNQINFLVPTEMGPGIKEFTVVVDGISGAPSRIRIADVVPGLYLLDAATAVAIDLSGLTITQEHPAIAGQWITLFATGLGETKPPASTGELALGAAPLIRQLRVLFDGLPVDAGYAGLAPGYAGLYQINVVVPSNAAARPEIRLDIEGERSPSGVFLPVRKPE